MVCPWETKDVIQRLQKALKNHRTVFIHGDLQLKNIIGERRGVCEVECADFKITLVDWNLADRYPVFWEFNNSVLHCQMKPDWLELIPYIFDQYLLEYLMMQVVYSSIFY
jgi:thiamine kinase-like enzyme